MPKLIKRTLVILSLFAIVSCLLFVFYKLNWQAAGYVLPRRVTKLVAFIITGSAIGFSTVIFQTITNNHILTPSIIGLDNLYMFIQTLVIFFFGSMALSAVNDIGEFMITVGLMLVFSLLLFRLMFGNRETSISTIILAGILCGGIFSSLSTFMQVLIDPNEFLLVQDKMFASFNNINVSLLGIAGLICLLALVYGYKNTRQLDVLSLGREIAINLGVKYDKVVYRYMLLVSLLIAVATALVGPVTFLGLLTANLSRRMFKTYQHRVLLSGSILLSIIALALGQFFIERVLVFSTTISVVINFIGGIYFIYLLVREADL